MLQIGAKLDFSDFTPVSGLSMNIKESIFVLQHNARYKPNNNSGHFWAQDEGSTLGGAPFPNYIPHNYLSEFTLKKEFDNKLSLEFGRMNPMMRFDALQIVKIY